MKSFFAKGETSERKKKSAKQSLTPTVICMFLLREFVRCSFVCVHFFFFLYPRWLMCNSFYSLVVVINIFPFVFVFSVAIQLREVSNCPFPRYQILERSLFTGNE